MKKGIENLKEEIATYYKELIDKCIDVHGIDLATIISDCVNVGYVRGQQQSTIELNDRVTVILTDKGSEIINDTHSIMNEHLPARHMLKNDYKAGDNYTCELWDLFGVFGPSCYHGVDVLFTDMTKFNSN